MASERHEIKYIVNKQYLNLLKTYLSEFMELDNFTFYDDFYYVRSMYFDDYKNTAYYEKLDGIGYREKYRIRYYNFDKSYINLEKKVKDKDFVIKYKNNITEDECIAILNKEYDKVEIDDDLMKEFILKCKYNKLEPSVIVDYKRTAYKYPIENIRVTIDEDIASLGKNLNYFDERVVLYNVLNENEVLLEVKYDDVFPKFLSKILDNIPKIKVSFSKYVLCKEIEL